jgi:hypothetical protein
MFYATAFQFYFSIQMGLKLNGTRQLLVYTDNVNHFGDNTDTINKNRVTTDASKGVGLEVKADKTKCMLLPSHQTAGTNHS